MIKNQQGIALLTVLWVLTILMVIVFSFSYLTRTETYACLSFKDGMEDKFLADAGIERALVELFYRRQNINNKLLVEGQEIWAIDGSPYSGQLGDGTYSISIIDESGKIDINQASEVVLKNLIKNFGIEEEPLDTIVDSILDWKDKDDLHRLHGAESDYYQSLPNPYKAKNADFDTLEELLMVKGVTKELLYGVDKKKGLIDYLTVQGKTRNINMNAAPKEVLMAIPGLTAEMADQIIAYRRIQEIKNSQELAGIIGTTLPAGVPITFGSSNVFTIESFGYRKKNRSGLGVKATVNLLGNNNYKILYYKTPVTITHEESVTQ